MACGQGARARMALAFETIYGSPPASGYTRMPSASTSLGAEQPLLNSELLGYGRDPLAPVKDAVTADGDVVVPIDAEALGFWLKAAFGAPVTTGTAPGPFTHTFQSGGWTLPSMAIETAMPEVPRYAMYSGVVLDQLSWQMQRTGLTVSLQGGRLFCLSAQDSERGLFQTKPDILIRRGGTVTHVIDTKWKRISSRIDDPKQGVSQADVYQTMAYAQLYRAPRLTLLYPHHPGLGTDEMIHARHRITGHATILETASIDVANSKNMLDRIRQLLIGDDAMVDAIV